MTDQTAAHRAVHCPTPELAGQITVAIRETGLFKDLRVLSEAPGDGEQVLRLRDVVAELRGALDLKARELTDLADAMILPEQKAITVAMAGARTSRTSWSYRDILAREDARPEEIRESILEMLRDLGGEGEIAAGAKPVATGDRRTVCEALMGVTGRSRSFVLTDGGAALLGPLTAADLADEALAGSAAAG